MYCIVLQYPLSPDILTNCQSNKCEKPFNPIFSPLCSTRFTIPFVLFTLSFILVTQFEIQHLIGTHICSGNKNQRVLLKFQPRRKYTGCSVDTVPNFQFSRHKSKQTTETNLTSNIFCSLEDFTYFNILIGTKILQVEG